jgi:hypothetical protein
MLLEPTATASIRRPRRSRRRICRLRFRGEAVRRQSRVASLRPVEAPSPAPANATGSEPAPQSTATALTRAESGSALAESGKNLQVSDLQAPAQATVASDSAVRRRSESSADSPQLLNSQQASRERRNQASSDQPQSAWKVNTESLASRSGSRAPDQRTAEASAATATTAAASAERSRLNAEAGTSQIDSRADQTGGRLGCGSASAEAEARTTSVR